MLTQTYHSSSSSLNSNVSHKSSSKNHKKKLSFTPKLMKSLSAFTAKCEDSSDSDNEFEITQTTLSYRNASINGNNKQQLNNLLFQTTNNDNSIRRCSSFYHLINNTNLTDMSSAKEIKDFYEYTINCFEIIEDIENIVDINQCKPLSFPFDNEINSNKRLAVFDLDETLIHYQKEDISTAQHMIKITLLNKTQVKIGMNIRPYWKEALDIIKNQYQIVVYTASHKFYSDPILDYIDPNNEYFKYRLYRNNCSSVKYEGKELYIKDLRIFKNINLKDIVIIDNSVLSFTYHINNGIPIMPFYNDCMDKELLIIAEYLKFLYKYNDLREANKEFLQLEKHKKMAIYECAITPKHENGCDEDEFYLEFNSNINNKRELYNTLEELRQLFLSNKNNTYE